jgi:hypothetical protein
MLFDSETVKLLSDAAHQTDKTDRTDAISNTEFIEAIFGTEIADNKPVVVSIAGKADSAAFRKHGKGKPFEGSHTYYPSENNNYFSLASFSPDSAGKYHRTKEQFCSLHCFFLDDIGTKVDAESIALLPSWVIETSAGNHQWGYILKEPLTEVDLVDSVMKAVIVKGLTDSGAGGATARLARLPVAQNTKKEPAFPCRLVSWNPELRYSVAEIIDGLKLDMNTTKTKSEKAKPKKSPSAVVAQEGIYKPRPKTNPVISALIDKGLYKHPLGNGKHDVTCPWVAEHTDQEDGGSAYFEPSENYPIGGYKCFHGHCEGKKIVDLLGYLQVTTAEAKMKPVISIITGELHRLVNYAEAALAETGEYYQRGSLIVVVVKEPSTRETQIKLLTNPSLTHALSKYITWEAYDFRSESYVPKDPPQRIVMVMLDSTKYLHFPPIRNIAHQPYLRDDYTLVCKRGYDAQSEMYGEFDPKAFSITAKPTKEDAVLALQKLETLLDDFGFASETDKAAALAAMLTAAVRPSLEVAPMFHVRAPMIGSGKSFLCQIITLFATERKSAPVAFPTEEEECRKLLFSEFMRSPAVIEFDNLTSDIKAYKSLCTALTNEHLSDRILGISKTATVNTRSLILSSGNNVAPIDDMVRRCITINLDTGIETPFARVFKNPNLLEDIRTQRENYVSAALTIILAWLSSGESKPECKSFATYNQWSNLCRYPLLWLGQADPVASVFSALNEDPERETLQHLLHEWMQCFDTRPMMIRQALDTYHNPSEELLELFHDIAGEKGTINRKRLGHYLKRHQKRVIDGLRFVRAAGNFSSTAWKVESVSSV